MLDDSTPLTPEMRLSVSIIEDGINAFLGNRSGSERFLEANAWLEEKDDSWVFSFEAICDRIGFSSSKVRKRTLEMRAKGIKRLPIGTRFRPHISTAA